MPHGFVCALESVPNLEFVDMTSFLELARAVKSNEEKSEIRATAAMQDAIFSKLLDTVKPGMRDLDVSAIMLAEARKMGGSQQVLFAGSAPSDGLPFPRTFYSQGRTIGRGDYLTVLIETNGAAGLYTELARTLVLGKASAERRDALAIACAAQEDTIKRYQPGVPCGEIATAHDEFRTKNGFSSELRLFAHGQGYALVERPLIRADESMKLAADMNLATHPAFVRGAMFAFVCDNFLVQADGPAERLHRTQQRVFEIPA
jgi:Xaa-Pro aminopeptidase